MAAWRRERSLSAWPLGHRPRTPVQRREGLFAPVNGQSPGLAFAVFIDGKRLVRLPTVTDGPRGLPVPAVYDLAVLRCSSLNSGTRR